MSPTNTLASIWKKRVVSARRRRELHEVKWAQYAKLHADSYVVARGENDDEGVRLPNGDQVLLGLVHRNVEQTMALLESPEIGVRATLLDTGFRQEEFTDTHKEALVEKALFNSLRTSGLLTRTEVANAVKLDAIIVGHGICYTWYREAKRTEKANVPKLLQDDSGDYFHALDDETGEPVYVEASEERTEWEGVQDEHVPVLEFLFESTAKSISLARWHGREQVVRLEDLRADDRYMIPEDVTGGGYRVRDLYGVDQDVEQLADGDWVKKVTIWDKATHKLLTFLDCPHRTEAGDDFLLIEESEWPLGFSHPDDSPFSAFVPIPANDKPFGVSQIEHIRNPAVEADKTRSRFANIVRMQKRLSFFDKASLSETDLQRAMNEPDMSLVGVNLPEGIRDINQLIHELEMPAINPDLYRASDMAEATVRNTSGISDVPLGGAQTATESQNLMSVGSARATRKQRILLDWFAQVAQRHCDFLAAFAPSGKTVMIADLTGNQIALEYGREAFQGRWDIKVLPSGGAFGLSPVAQKTLLELSGAVLGKFGPTFDRAWLGVVFEKFDVPNAQRLLSTIPVQPQPPVALPAGVPAQTASPNLNDYTDAQAIRAGINAASE